MHYTFIVNPTAGNGRAGKALRRLETAITDLGLDYSLQVTERPRQAAGWACDAAKAGCTVVAAGGDGTFHEVACGIIRSGNEVPLGLIPIGTGNDFASCLRIPRTLEEAVRALQTATPRHLDYGLLRWREAGSANTLSTPFINAIGAGFDAQVAARAAGRKTLSGLAAYLSVIPGVLRRWTPPQVRITEGEEDERYRGKLFLVTVANGTSSGGGFRLTPRARMDDGLLDLCIVEHLGPGRIAQLLPKVLVGRHESAPEVHHGQITSVRLESDHPLAIHADGEVVTRSAVRFDVEVISKGLSVLLPASLFETQARNA